MLSVQSLKVEFGARVLFDDLSFVVQPGEKISFAGANGAGKSTLMKCIAGILSPNSGKIVLPRGFRVGYLPQEGIHLAGHSVWKEAQGAFAEGFELQEKIENLGHELARLDPMSSPYNQLLEEIGECEIQLEHYDLARVKPRIEAVLRGLGFQETDFQRDCGEFSGGWQMRLALSKLLLAEPEVLLLDEPTNHLDIDSQAWMEKYLATYRGAILLISHDKSLLDMLTTRTIAFHHGRAEEYAGNYSFYLRESAIRKDVLIRQYKAQQREIAKSKQFIDRFRAQATKASLVQSRIKMMEKIEVIEIEDDDAEVSFRFPPPPSGGHSVVKLENIAKNYGKLCVFENLDFEIEKGDRIAIVGANGAGKSTFSRLISGQEPPSAGRHAFGHKVQVAFFSQNHADELMPDKTVIETVEEVASREARPLARNLLGCFLFRGDDVFKKVGVLSGGERSRVALVRMLVQPANFLILDEPTNHLDMKSQEVLQQALLEYPGTYCIVSHNRGFLDPITTKVLEFLPGRGMKVFLGNVTDYLEKKERDQEFEKKSNMTQNKGVVSFQLEKPGEKNRKEQRRIEAEIRQRKSRELNPLEEELAWVETEIAELEKTQVAVTESLNAPEISNDPELLRVATHRYQRNSADLEQLYSRWDSLSQKVEQKRQEIEDIA